jgi:hypothetical protein
MTRVHELISNEMPGVRFCGDLTAAFYSAMGAYRISKKLDMSGKRGLFNGSKDYIRVSVGYAGKYNGSLCIVVPMEFCSVMNEILFARDPSLAGTCNCDFIRRLSNFVCGDFLSRRSGGAGLPDIGVPRVDMLNAKEWNELAEKISSGFTVMGMPLILYAKMQKGCAA